MKKKEHVEGTKKPGNIGETATLANKEIMIAKPSVSLKYPEWIHFSTKCMVKGTYQGHWDDICKLDDKMKFLFTYGVGEVVIKNGDEKYLIPGVYYAPEVTLNVLSIEQLERQGIEIIYENYTCRLIYVFSNLKDHKLNEDKLKTMQNEYLEEYFESLKKGDTSNAAIKTLGMKDDLIEIKGTIYSTRVNTFNEYVAFLNLLEQDEIISQEWDVFRNKFDKAVKWFYEKYLERSLPGPITPKINGVTIHLMDLYKIVESLGGYLSVYFAREFGKIGEILGLSIQDGEEVRRCYINFMDVFTCYYKTARVPKQEHNLVLDIPTKIVKEGKEYTCLASHQFTSHYLVDEEDYTHMVDELQQKNEDLVFGNIDKDVVFGNNAQKVNEEVVDREEHVVEDTRQEKLQDDCDIQATNIVLQRLPPDVYSLVNQYQAAKDIWDKLVQVNTKFLNALQPEWSKFVTDVKLAKNLYTTNYDQLYAYLSQHEGHANEARPTRVVKCYNYQGEGHMARQCTKPKRPRNSAWFKEKMLLVQAQESGQVSDEEQLAFLTDPEITEIQDTQTTIPYNVAFRMMISMLTT
nr:ARID DNA-binding domain-containing protein [Tanacetum cinerariifolium]